MQVPKRFCYCITFGKLSQKYLTHAPVWCLTWKELNLSRKLIRSHIIT